ncbi:MAG: DUF721 domain-containing protein [Thermodesulfobacteriota bacterium]
MQRKNEKPESIRNILAPFLKRTGLNWRIKEQKIIKNWKEIVGRDIAQNTVPSKLRGGVLYIKVSNPIWIQHLQFLKEIILKNIHQEIKEVVVDDLRFFLGNIDSTAGGYLPANKEKGEENIFLSREQEIREFIPKEIEEKIAQIRDPELRQLLSALYTKNKQGKGVKI